MSLVRFRATVMYCTLNWFSKSAVFWMTVFVIARIIKGRRLRLVTLTKTFIILDTTKTESHNCFIRH